MGRKSIIFFLGAEESCASFHCMEQGEGLELNRLEFDCGVFYGEVYDGKASGLGEYSCADGAKYIGNWINDSIDGQGLYWLADGLRCIDGDWTDGSPLHGRGRWYLLLHSQHKQGNDSGRDGRHI